MISVTPPLIVYSRELQSCEDYNPAWHRLNKSTRSNKIVAYMSPVIFTSYEGDVAEQGTVITEP